MIVIIVRYAQNADTKINLLFQDLSNCLVVNPGQLTEGNARGTFGRLVITPTTENQKALISFMACQIIKL